MLKLNIQLFGGRGASSYSNSRNNIDGLLRDSAKINPNYSTGEKGYLQNCQSCTLAFILREKGEDVVAISGTGNTWKDGNGNKITLSNMFNGNPEKIYYIVGQRRFDDKTLAKEYAMNTNYKNIYWRRATEKSIFMNSSEAIEREVKSWGNNASGYISVDWKGRRGGHVFNIKNINGKVVAIDTQSNKVRDLKDTLSRAKPQFTYITRTDNLKVNERLKKYMVRGG